MTKEKFIELLNGLQKIQLESLNDRSLIMWVSLNNYDYPTDIRTTISVTLFIGSQKNQHSYSFLEGDGPKDVWNNLDDIHKRFRKRPLLRNLVKELKEKFKQKKSFNIIKVIDLLDKIYKVCQSFQNSACLFAKSFIG